MGAKRGTQTTIPRWWFKEIERALEERGWTQADLAAEIAGVDEGRAFKAVEVRVSRFIRGLNNSAETAAQIAQVLKLPAYVYHPRSRRESEVMALAIDQESELAQAVLLQQMLKALGKDGMTIAEALAKARELRDSPPEGEKRSRK